MTQKKSRPATKPARKSVPVPDNARNTRLNVQMRKVLSKHYRAKHGVK
jgi:hypothetical protein